MKREQAVLLLVGAALCFSLGGMLIKWVEWNPIAIAGTRSGIAAVLVYIVFPRMRITWSFFQLAGALAYASNMILFVVANKMTTAANAVLLQYTAPAWVALFSAWFLRERIQRSDWLTIGLVTGGIFLFFADRLTFSGLWGNLWAIASGFSYAWVFLLFRRQKDLDPAGSLFLGNIFTALVCIPFMLQGSLDLMSVIGLFLLGVVQIGVAYSLYTVAIKNVTALDASIILLLEPILNPVWTYLALGEIPGPWAMVGGVIILGAITYQTAMPYLRGKNI